MRGNENRLAEGFLVLAVSLAAVLLTLITAGEEDGAWLGALVGFGYFTVVSAAILYLALRQRRTT